MTSQFTVGVGDIQVATGWGRTRVRSLIRRPYPLAYKKLPSSSKGGNRTRLYRLDELLVRLSNHRDASEQMLSNLIAADAAYRQKETGNVRTLHSK